MKANTKMSDAKASVKVVEDNDDDVVALSSGGGDQTQHLHRHHQNPTTVFDSENEILGTFCSFRSPEDTSLSSDYFKTRDDTSRSSYEEEDAAPDWLGTRIGTHDFSPACGTSKRMKLSQKGRSVESSEEESSPLGLKLRKTPSFINFVETKLNEMRQRKLPSPTKPLPYHPKKQHKMKETMTMKDKENEKLENEKLKASNFPALHLKIGTWERNSRHEGDLVAKCYYKKGRLVWEVLEGALKSKIEVQWSDIIGIRASKADDESGILEIELNEKPLFFKETNPQPRKHTLWQQAEDFTGGQALICRRHCVRFAPGLLDKHYDRLLQYDQRLFMLSKMPFPSKPCYFPEYQMDFNVYPSYMHNPMPPYHYYPSFPASMTSPSLLNMRSTNTRPQYVNQNPTMPVSNVILDNQAILNEATNIASGSYVQVARPITSVVLNNVHDFPNYPHMGYPNQDMNTITQGQGSGISPPNATLFDMHSHLLGDMQAINERTLSARASSMLLPVEVVGGRTINEQTMIQSVVGENSTTNHEGIICSDSSSNWYNGMIIQPPTNDSSFYQYGWQNHTNE